MDVIEDKFAHRMDYFQAIDRNKFTSSKVVASHVKLAEECFVHGARYSRDPLNEEICMIAALEGRKDIVKMGITFGVSEHFLERIDAEVMGEIVAKGDLEMMQLLLGVEQYSDLHGSCIESIVYNAARNGHINILKWLFNDDSNEERRYEFRSRSRLMFLAASGSGHLDIIEWGKDITEFADYYEYTKYESFRNALKGGHISLVRWYRDQGLPFDEDTLPLAAESRNIELLEYLLHSECPNDNPLTCAKVFSTESDEYEESLHILKWLREERNVPWDEDTCCSAAGTGNINALKWARANGCAWNEGTLSVAVEMGHFQIVEYCLENGAPFANEHAYIIALGNLDIPDALKMIKLLRRFEIPMNEQVCAEAAGNAHIEALKWLRSIACPWDDDTFYCALQSCDVPTIQYCIDNSCPVNDDDSLYACAVRCDDPLKVLKILKEHNFTSWTVDTSAVAAEENNIRVLQWLRHNGCAWDEWVCHNAVRNNNYHMLKYAHNNGCPWTKETYAYCFHCNDGIEHEFSQIPKEPICLEKIFTYLQIFNCPKPEEHEWRLRRPVRVQIDGNRWVEVRMASPIEEYYDDRME
ncbi:hypothetical protein CTEN210_09850 [Chaetoceros tenuissimus]|uniref:Ankyrin repeat-containing domain n=1 Tax=Chaetoceros tenuissimus TaxID=426638 RepID=A0AAD3H822_9STRA|nr:hypothetical protein CTEN210_09850 [Chaetoceros tenuissimus]